jgi:enoyl-CoA hydratase/carnithine racemase
MAYETIGFDVQDGVAAVTLNRPQVMNCFNSTMCEEIKGVWESVRADKAVNVVLLQAAGDRAFCTGIDRKQGIAQPDSPWQKRDPGSYLGPKANGMFKPVITAVQGMCAGGAFYFLNESDIIICSEDATFFDPHVTYGMVSALEPLGLARRIPYGEVMRWTLLGLDERMSASRALQIGLVSEVVERSALSHRGRELATRIAAKPGVTTEGTVKAVWQGMELTRDQAQVVGLHYPYLGNELGTAEAGKLFESGTRPSFEVR